MKIFSSSGALCIRRRVSVKGIRALFGWPASRGRHQNGGEQPKTGERGQPEVFSRFGWAGRGRLPAGFRFGGRGRAKNEENGDFLGKPGVLGQNRAFWALRNDVLALSDADLEDSDGVLPCAGGVLPCAGGVLSCSDGVLSCTDGALPRSGGILSRSDGVLPCSGGIFEGEEIAKKRGCIGPGRGG